MKSHLQQHMFLLSTDQAQFRIRGCHIMQIRYKPTRSCMVSYRLDIEDTATGTCGEQILCGRAYPAGVSQAKWKNAVGRTFFQPRFGKPMIHLTSIDMILWSFPNDRKIHTLPTAIETTLIPTEPPLSWIRSYVGTEWQIVTTDSRVVHYVGEHTCTVKTSVDMVHPMEHRPQTITLFGKTYYDEEGAQTDRVMRQLWDSHSRRSGRLRLAQPIWYDGPRKTLWQLGINGATLEASLLGDSQFVPLLRKAAHAIAALHGTPLANIQPLTIADLLDRLDTVGSMLMQQCPSSRSLVVSLLARLHNQVRMVPLSPTATLHGDLHLKNLFLANGTISLIDLDNVREGPPEWDIGSFLAGLVVGGLSTQASDHNLVSDIQVFLDHYNQSALWTIAMPTVAWCTAMALVIERGHRCVTRLKDNPHGQLERVLRCADHISKACSLDALNSQEWRALKEGKGS
ncbi:MAG: phosphotransferase family protein [Nitrospira sp.]